MGHGVARWVRPFRSGRATSAYRVAAPLRVPISTTSSMGRGDHTAEVIFQLHEDRAAVLDDGRLTIDRRFSLTWSATAKVDAALYRGAEPADGPDCSAARHLQTGSALRADNYLLRRAPGPTTIVDGERWTLVRALRQRGASSLVHELSNGAVTEVVGASDGTGVTAGGRETDGAVGVWREEAGRLVEAARIGGTFITTGMAQGALR